MNDLTGSAPDSSSTVRTRFAPSPTGVLHIGGARTALFNWLLARRHGGAFVLRIEDTDTARSTRDSIDQIVDAMSWLGLRADEGPLLQTDRLDRYRTVAGQLVEAGRAYRCYCSREELAAMREEQRSQGLKPRYDGRCRTRTGPSPGGDSVVRFKTPARGSVRVRDLIRGEVTFDNSELDDLVILRSDGVPTYNFSVVVDDADMRITHVVRGDDHLNNTPRQLNILSALKLRAPQYAHVPMILGPDGSRLSKRHGAVSVTDYRDAGYLPEAVLNYMVRLGWSHGDRELFGVDEMIRAFSLDQVNQSAASFDPEKFLWVNEQWIRRAPADRLASPVGHVPRRTPTWRQDRHLKRSSKFNVIGHAPWWRWPRRAASFTPNRRHTHRKPPNNTCAALPCQLSNVLPSGSRG